MISPSVPSMGSFPALARIQQIQDQMARLLPGAGGVATGVGASGYSGPAGSSGSTGSTGATGSTGGGYANGSTLAPTSSGFDSVLQRVQADALATGSPAYGAGVVSRPSGRPSGQPDWTVATAGLAPGTPYAAQFESAAARTGVSARLLAAVAQTESSFDPTSRSSVGAQGLMQFMPGTAASYGVDVNDPASSIDGAARYLADLTRRFGRVDLALAAYNVGPGVVAAAGNQVPASARRYVDKVLSYVHGGSG